MVSLDKTPFTVLIPKLFAMEIIEVEGLYQ